MLNFHRGLVGCTSVFPLVLHMDSPVHHPDILVSEYPTKQPSSERWIKHYCNFHQILLVGEGDFSFSSALANAFGSAKNMVPTSLDSRETVESSYKSGKTNLKLLKRGGAMTLHGVDATTMDKLESIRERKFDRIVYNFPHAGFFGKEEDEKVIQKHRYLVEMFFKNASKMLSRIGEIHVTHKEFHPYNNWKLVEQAEKHGLVLKESVEFKKADYPGYTNRRGAASRIGETFNLGKCHTYIFMKRESMATTALLPRLSPEAHEPKSLETAILELEYQLRARKRAETAKPNWDASLSHLKTLADKVMKEKDEYRRQRDDVVRQRNEALHQKNEACRENEYTLKLLTRDLSLKDRAIKEKDVSLKEALLELKSERQTLKAAETAKADLKASFAHCMNEVLHLNEALKSQRDDAIHQKNEACRENENTLKQLTRDLSLKDRAIKEKDVSLKEALWELESERQALKAAETAKADLKASFAHSMNEVLHLNEALKSQRDDAIHQKNEACRENENTLKQFTRALSSKDTAIKEKDVRLKEALSELEFKRQALKAAETAKADLKSKFHRYELSLHKALRNELNQLTRKDDALYEKVCRESEIIAKQLEENSRWTWKSLALFFGNSEKESCPL